jgi:hypothetical protein
VIGIDYNTRKMKSSNKVIAVAAVLTAAALVLAVAATTIVTTQSAFAFASIHRGNSVTKQIINERISVSGNGRHVVQDCSNVIITGPGGGSSSGCR